MDIVAGFQALIAVFPKIVYLLTMSILGVIDVFQLLFRKLAGLDCYYVDGTAQTGDLIYDFLRGILFGEYPILSNVFFGLLILGFILLFLSTIVAIIRNEYTTEKADNTKGKIIGKAFKSVIYFAIVPVVVLFGVYLANVVLVAVDRATTYNVNYGNTLDKSKLQAVDVASVPIVGQSTGQKTYTTYSLLGFRDANGLPFGTTTTTFSGTIFKAAAYGANRVRTTMNVADETQNFGLLLKTNQATNFNGLFSDPSGNLENIAVRIDIAFADNVVFAQSVQQTLDYSSAYAENNNPTGIDPFAADRTTVYTVADKFDVGLVWYYYDLWQFNYIIALGAAIIMVTIFINIIFGLMRRIIEMIGLFLMAPPLIALMPLDNEKAYGSWRGSFIKKALMAYGAVGGMNIILLLLPELQKISFFNITSLDWIVDTLLVLVALLAVKDFIGVVSGFAGGDDANKTGEGVAKDVGDLAAKGAKFAASTIGVATSVGGAAVAGGRIAKDFAVAGKRKAQSLMHGAGSTHNRQTKIARDRLKQEHEAEARAEAEDNIYEQYKTFNIGALDASMQAHDPAMVQLKATNSAKYQQILEQKLKEQYKADRDAGLDLHRNVPVHAADRIDNLESTAKGVIFRDKQSKVNVTYQDFYDQSEHGKYRKERAEQKALIAAADTRTLKRERKRELNQLKYNYYSQMALKVSQPVTNATKNFYQMTMNTLMDNSFMNTLRGKDGENIEDIGHRLRGHTKAEIDKIKAAQKEEAKDTKRLLKEQDMLLSVLRQIEKEKNSEKE
ncbi:MAG: hypothetical protein ACLRFR_02705 [Clostridia bacterium]